MTNSQEEKIMNNPQVSPQSSLTLFLAELTELSLKHSIGIAGKPVPFIMEHNDYDRQYRCDDNGDIEFSLSQRRRRNDEQGD